MQEPAHSAAEITVEGIVQGVGFRPFIWKLARSLALAGSVRNNPDGVRICLEGHPARIEEFLSRLANEPPPLARISATRVTAAVPRGLQGFEIQTSTAGGDFSTRVMPDVALCDDCRAELLDPGDRRYRYPFINCTNCGPRFSIIQGLPYDRAATSMAGFQMCPDCAAEYADPADRRYHAQPIACPACGPQMTALLPDGSAIKGPWERAWEDAIRKGRVVAVKGVGGFHLACNALDEQATGLLRRRKHREAKPFALMIADLDWVKSVCEITAAEQRLLCSRERPIVLLQIRRPFPALRHIAPGLATLGVMLPYAPLHVLLCAAVGVPLVMTSANYSSEPMIHTNRAALDRLAGLADLFLVHNRDIANRCDDSVCMCVDSRTMVIRPGRGIAPFAITCRSPQAVLAFGADMKNTFAVARHGRITLSQYIGDLEHPEAQELLLSNVEKHLQFFKTEPGLIVHDLHPDYFSTRIASAFARRRTIPALAVQHHHAHLAAAHVEHGLDGRAIGFAFDGTGYGADGTVWGGEVMVFDRNEFHRELFLRPMPLPGGDSAVRQPERMLLSYLLHAGLLEQASSMGVLTPGCDAIVRMIQCNINSPLTSSSGRLFDAVACLLGACRAQTYDGEAAMRLEALASPDEQGLLPFAVSDTVVDCAPLFEALLEGLARGTPAETLAGRFHNTMAEIIVACGERLAERCGDLPWVFAGGVFQNRLLVEKLLRHRRARQHRLCFSAYPNDSGIALGQAAIGIAHHG